MKKMWNDAKFVVTALQACSIVAMVMGVALMTTVRGVTVSSVVTVGEAVLWWMMWWSFLRMCGRLKREPSAFTQANARTLLVIAVCCGASGLMEAVEAVVFATTVDRGLLFGGWMGGLATVAFYFGVAAVALILLRLLKSAMVLQQDSDLTI